MSTTNDLVSARFKATTFTDEHLVDLCKEYAEFKKSGLFGRGKLAELRVLCNFAGASAQSLATSMVENAAVTSIASTATKTFTMDELGYTKAHIEGLTVSNPFAKNLLKLSR